MASLINSLASLAWSSVNRVAREASRLGYPPKTILEPRVISVGNLQAGGTGKTPLTSLICKEAHEQGLRVCILIRGYRGRWENSGGVIAPGQGKVSADECGDEAALLHSRNPEAWIGVGADRAASYVRVQEASERAKFDLIVLDDGFQNFSIHKDLDIVALTSSTSAEAVFRDSHSQLQHAGLVVWTKGHEQPDFLGRPACRVIYEIPAAAADRPESDKNVWLVTGVADADQVKATTERAGYRVLRHIAFADHQVYRGKETHALMDGARMGGARLALTGKDWVKWEPFGIERSSVIVLEPELRFVSGRDVWEKVVWGR
jgi:tetraacyldisaccharide 4'-kinase